MRLHSKKTLLVMTLVILTLIIMIVPDHCRRKRPKSGRFPRAERTGRTQFSNSTDMKLVAQEGMARYGLSADRYRQFVGEAEVLGGQLTVYEMKRARPLTSSAVIIRIWPRKMKSN